MKKRLFFLGIISFKQQDEGTVACWDKSPAKQRRLGPGSIII